MKQQKNQDLEERKLIANNLIDKAFKLYPEWESSGNFSKPTYPEKLDMVDLSNKQMTKISLSDTTKSVLCGTILGDTNFSIPKKYSNARFIGRHSTRQFTWFTWKYLVVLKEFTTKSAVIFSYPSGYQKSSPLRPGEEILGKLQITSKVDEKLTELHKIICKENKKKIERFWLNHMNNYFLMTLWLDDGSLSSGRQGSISLNSSPTEEQEVLRHYLWKVWGIETKLQDTGNLMQNGQKSYRINILNQDSLLKLLTIVAPVIPVREMLYKVCFVPKGNSSLLQRWKTELKKLVKPEFADDIENYYSDIDNLLKMQETPDNQQVIVNDSEVSEDSV